MIKEYIKEYKKLVSRTTPQKDDTCRLLSWIIYKEFFPQDFLKLANRTGIVFTRNTKEIESYGSLFEYLVSEECPEFYRINYLCMRFVNLQPQFQEEYLKEYRTALKNKDYPIALGKLESAICCNPTKALKKRRERLLPMVQNDNQEKGNCCIEERKE